MAELPPHASNRAGKKDLYEAPDYYQVDELLSEEHRLIRSTIREWVKNQLTPVIEDFAQRAEFPRHILSGLAEIGAFGPTLPVEYGGAGLDYISYGIIMQELERGDSGIRSTASVQGSLVMYPIFTYGSAEQKKKYLPKLATAEWLGAWGLTEANTGSDAGNMKCTAVKDGNDWIINGQKIILLLL